MKKFLLLAIAFIAFQTSFAQTFAKGDTFVEGTVKFVTGDADKTFNFNPSVGYFATEKIAVGVELNTQSTKNAAGAKTSDSFGVGAFARCYFLSIGDHLRVYSQLGLSANDDKATNVKSTDLALGLGANYFITKNLSLTMKVADLAKFSSVKTGGVSSSETTVGFSGVTNPLNLGTFGLNYRF